MRKSDSSISVLEMISSPNFLDLEPGWLER